jgi:cilia- and flagella-associated protein 57
VLDEKIQDLRRDITPKEKEIKDLRNRTKSMDKRLKKYNEVNASLGFMVEDLRVRQTCIFKAIGTNGDIIRNNNTIIENFKNAVF